MTTDWGLTGELPGTVTPGLIRAADEIWRLLRPGGPLWQTSDAGAWPRHER
jgi:hypothetical protein